ncbi:MAG: hypothetical protein R3353_00330 [Salegentibacter mishustinae]|nr:hypothetical protein [Salegentibacter mishustinae]
MLNPVCLFEISDGSLVLTWVNEKLCIRSKEIYNPKFHTKSTNSKRSLKAKMIRSSDAITELIWIAKLLTSNPKITAFLRILRYTA